MMAKDGCEKFLADFGCVCSGDVQNWLWRRVEVNFEDIRIAKYGCDWCLSEINETEMPH